MNYSSRVQGWVKVTNQCWDKYIKIRNIAVKSNGTKTKKNSRVIKKWKRKIIHNFNTSIFKICKQRKMSRIVKNSAYYISA